MKVFVELTKADLNVVEMQVNKIGSSVQGSDSPVSKRRIELTVPNFMMTLAIIADSNMIAALPSQLVATHAARFGVVGVKPPLPPRRDKIRTVVSRATLTAR
ncbi:MAG: hypothetical protein ACT4OU_05170 [Hyphomicrobium sp.]